MQKTSHDGRSHICPRTETVAALAAKLDKHRVVNARGTRGTGKTTLAKLLASYYRGRGEQVIVATKWKGVTDPVQHLVDLGNSQGWQGIDHEFFTDPNVVVILGEAHHSYPDLTLWLGLIKTQSGRSKGPRICLFSLFGSPTTGRTVYPEGTLPVYFTPEQRVNFATTEPYLYVTRAEYDDVVDRLCLSPCRELKFDEKARDYGFDITMGHPAAVESFMRFLYDFYRSVIELDKSKIVTTDIIVNATGNDEKVFQMLRPYSVSETFPNRWILTSKALTALKDTRLWRSIPFDLEDSGIRLCYEEGWIFTEIAPDGEVVVMYPSRVHEKSTECFLMARDPKYLPKEPEVKLMVL